MKATTAVIPELLRDTDIEQKVREELRWDTRVRDTAIGVAADNGIVTLTGRVGSYAEKTAAWEAAHRVAGVLDVVNNTVVDYPSSLFRADMEIADAVRQALEWNVLVPHRQIRTVVANGWVTLEGSVSNWSQRQDAENAVLTLLGVRGVINKIQVIDSEVDPKHVRMAIEAALERQAEREGRHIQVDLHEGTVCLTGTVHSWAEKKAILGAAGHAPGVYAVEDHLHVNPFA